MEPEVHCFRNAWVVAGDGFATIGNSRGEVVGRFYNYLRTVASASSPPKRLLIVDDDQSFRADFCQLLAELGYKVVGEAGNGVAAIDAAHAAQADLVLMDAHLPGAVDGIEAAGLIRQAGGPPVLVMSASTDPDCVERARVAGATGYLVKPFSVEQAVASIEFAI